MNATRILMDEHRVIEQVLAVLEAIARSTDESASFDASSARQAIDFLRSFADRCHHGKEERCLFPMVEARGLPRLGGPTGVMLHEHDMGRQLIATMIQSMDENDGRRFAAAASDYVRLLREHIQKEDQCLFPMAEQMLGSSDDEQLTREFESIEIDDMEQGAHEKYLQIANDLALRFGVPISSRVSGAGTCSHHGK